MSLMLVIYQEFFVCSKYSFSSMEFVDECCHLYYTDMLRITFNWRSNVARYAFPQNTN